MATKTGCPIDCYDGCSVIASVDPSGRIQLEGNPNHPITRGTLCNRGRQLSVRRDSPNRILHPLKRVDDHFEEIPWGQALREIGRAMNETLASVGHHGILHIYDWGSGAVLKNLNQRFFYQLGGCTETVGSLCWDAGLQAQTYDFGRADSHLPDDMADHAEAIVVWGRNVANTNVHMLPYLKRAQKRGAPLVVISTLEQDLGRRADKVIHPRPGSDGILALGVLRVCRDAHWLDETFLRDHAIGWEDLAAELDAYSMDVVTTLTDVSEADVQWLAALYGTQGPVATLLGLGMQRYARGGNTVRAIDALAAVTGHIGVPGGGVNYAQRQVGAFFDEEAIMGKSAADVRTFERTTQAEEILAADPPIEVAFVTRTNPAVQVPDSAQFRKAFGSIRCKVVIDTFMTQTAQMADYVLPCTNVLEEEDVTYTTMWHPFISYIRPVVPPKGETKPDWQIFRDLAAEIGRPEIMAGEVEEWIDKVLAPFGCDAIEDLRQNGFVRLPIGDIPWADMKFRTPSGKFEFASSTAKQDGQHLVATCLPTEDELRSAQTYPYVLLTTHPRKMQNSQRDTMAQTDTPTIEVPTAVAIEKGLTIGDLVRVFNDQAQVIATVSIRSGGHAGTVRLEAGWAGQGITTNDFTTTQKADFASQSALYECRCQLDLVSSKIRESAEWTDGMRLVHHDA